MAAGEYVSVQSSGSCSPPPTRAPRPRPRSGTSTSTPTSSPSSTGRAAGRRARPGAGRRRARLSRRPPRDRAGERVDAHEEIGTALGAAASSFCFFASGALIPVLPYLVGMEGLPAIAVASVLVGVALCFTGATVGVLSGASPVRRALRQLAIGFGAAAATYALGLVFGATVG